MGKIFIVTGIIILLALGGRAFWAYRQVRFDEQQAQNNILITKDATSSLDTQAGIVNDNVPPVSQKDEITPSSPTTVFTCGTSTVTDTDGYIYNTVKIGTQCWMQQNMRVGKEIKGAQIQSNNNVIEKYCYDDLSSNCSLNHPNYPDGGLYLWDEAMQYSVKAGTQGICPVGWHIPTDAEFYALENFVDPTINDSALTSLRGVDVGTKLKVGGTSHFEFNPAGYNQMGHYFGYGQKNGGLWSSSEGGATPYSAAGTTAWVRNFYSKPVVARNLSAKVYGFSVRCIKD